MIHFVAIERVTKRVAINALSQLIQHLLKLRLLPLQLRNFLLLIEVLFFKSINLLEHSSRGTTDKGLPRHAVCYLACKIKNSTTAAPIYIGGALHLLELEIHSTVSTPRSSTDKALYQRAITYLATITGLAHPALGLGNLLAHLGRPVWFWVIAAAAVLFGLGSLESIVRAIVERPLTRDCHKIERIHTELCLLKIIVI